MINPQRYFPWKVARHFYFRHLAFVLVTLVVTGFSLRYFVFTTFLKTSDIHAALARFDSYLTSLFVSVMFVAAGFLALSTRQYVIPLGRLIQRARQLRRLDAGLSHEDLEPSEIEDEPGEWDDLERAINRLHKDLRRKTKDLSREHEELSALVGGVSDAILAVDSDENPLFFNSQFALLFRSGQSGLKQVSLSGIFRVPEVLQAYREVLATGQMKRFTTSLQTSAPLPRHFSVAIAPLKAGDEKAFGALGIFHDVTELRQSEQIRIEFVANASHELRTPLTNIKGYVDTLKSDLDQQRYQEAKDFAEVISKNVDRLTLLISDLLDLSTLESGAELKMDTVGTREVTENALRQIETKRAARRQEVKVHYAVEALHGDFRRIEQVVINLVHNAVKYTPEGSRIEMSWESAADHSVILRVKDNGLGIPAEYQSRLFERFYRGDTGRARDAGGTGLGLSIVKHIMIKHGGTVSVSSRPGEGAEFVCVFPA